MFLKACESAFVHTGLITHTVKAGICFSRWSRNRWENQKYNNWLFQDFSKDTTLKALNHFEMTADPVYKLEPQDLITFDKLSESANSETHRVFDLYHKKFFALKTLSLDSEAAWKEFNLMLRQHFNEMSRLATIRSFDYNEANKQVKILSEIQKTTIGDYAYFRKRQGLKWNSQQLKAVMWNLLKTVKVLKSQDPHVDHLKADHIFLDSKEGKFKAFEYLSVNTGHTYSFQHWGWHCGDATGFDVAVHTLVKIVDPHAPVDNPEEARAYLNINYPEFKADLLDIEIRSKDRRYFPSDLLPLEQIFESKDYDKYLLGNLKKTFDQKSGLNTQENWAFVNQGLGKFSEAEVMLQGLLDENISRFGVTHPLVTKSYLNLAELYQDQEKYDLSSKYFRDALNSSRLTSIHDKELLGRLHMKHGKLLMKLNPDNNQPAMNELQKAHDVLQHDVLKCQRLKQEIEKTLNELKNSDFNNMSCNPQDWEKRRWKKRKLIKIIFYLLILKWIYNKWFGHSCHEQGTQRNAPPPSSQNEIKSNRYDQPQPAQQQKPLEPRVVQKSALVSVSQEKAKAQVEPSLPKAVVVPPNESQEDSKFAWLLFGLNVAIGFAGLTLPSAN